MFEDSIPKLCTLCKDYSENINDANRTSVSDVFCDVVHKRLQNLPLSPDLVLLVNRLSEARFNKSSKERLMIEGKLQPTSPDTFQKYVVLPLINEMLKKIKDIKGVDIQARSFAAWGAHTKKVETFSKSISEADKVLGWVYRENCNYLPMVMATLIEPLHYCYLNSQVAAWFSDIYDGRWQKIQQRLIPQTSRPATHVFKCADQKMWTRLEFILHGIIRPVDYLAHLLTEMAVNFTFGLKMFTSACGDATLSAHYDGLVEEHGVDIWQMLSKIIDPACYWDKIKAVDEKHFPGVYEQNTPFSHVAKLFGNATPTVNEESILKTELKDQVMGEMSKKQESGKTGHLVSRGYSRYSAAVREAIFKEILPIIVLFGMDPKFERPVKKSVIDQLSKCVCVPFLGFLLL